MADLPRFRFTFRSLRAFTLASLCAVSLSSTASAWEDVPPRLGDGWKRNGLATIKYEINGAAARSNPLRRQLAQPYAGDEIFFRYRLRYEAESIDVPPSGDGEFFVFWLDEHEGGESSTHSGGVPNAGIHVDANANRFMVRFAPGNQKFAAKLVGDRDYLVVGRLWKSNRGKAEPYDRLDLWVDPEIEDRAQPLAQTTSSKAIRRVGWIGFSTGVKTEIDDRIAVWDIDVSSSWHEIMGHSEPPGTSRPELVKRTVDFKQHVYPILQEHCFSCHAGEEAEQGVRLDILDEVLNQTTPRNAKASELYQLAATGQMPPEGEGPRKPELEVLRTWIDEGLDWDEQLLPTPVPTSDHWSFQAIRRPAIPAVNNKSWTRTPVDAFIARRQEELGIRAAPEASTPTLDRRVSLDLLGLPPTSVDIDSPASHIDRVLSHPAYGERWARHWLDVARWAESNGHQHNRDRPHAWRYRDWVIEALHSNKPYDQFVRQQIAGDELSPLSDENVIATGFLAAARYSGNELDKDIQRNDILTDVTNTTASAFLGLTLECAQCHTHKFDPLSIRDYYRFQAFFAKGQPANVVLQPDATEVKRVIKDRWSIFDDTRSKLISAKRRQGIANPIVIRKNVLAAIKGEQRKRFDTLEKTISQLPQVWAWQSANSQRPQAVAPHEMRFPLPRDPTVLAGLETYLLIRGDVKSRGPVVQPSWPTVFTPATTESRPTTAEDPSADVPAGRPSRTDLANWLVGHRNPLTARVWVNRIWQWHFGRGLVETSNDFGTQGTKPSHPELLDFLASELIEKHWDTNHIHRLIVNSATYRQSHKYSQHAAAIDPDNRSYWRWIPRRLEAEAIRDAVLAVSGQLDLTRGGPSVSERSTRRSIYLKQRRNGLPSQQQLFDGTTGQVSCSRRRVTTTPLQPLWLLNSEFMQQASRHFATYCKTIEQAFQLALNRKPTDEELAVLRRLEDDHGLESVCLVILNSSEFLYLK